MVVRSNLRDVLYRLNQTAEQPIRQATIAQATNLTRKTISVWMNHRKPLNRIEVSTWLAIAQFLGVDPNELIKIEPDLPNGS